MNRNDEREIIKANNSIECTPFISSSPCNVVVPVSVRHTREHRARVSVLYFILLANLFTMHEQFKLQYAWLGLTMLAKEIASGARICDANKPTISFMPMKIVLLLHNNCESCHLEFFFSLLRGTEWVKNDSILLRVLQCPKQMLEWRTIHALCGNVWRWDTKWSQLKWI